MRALEILSVLLILALLVCALGTIRVEPGDLNTNQIVVTTRALFNNK